MKRLRWDIVVVIVIVIGAAVWLSGAVKDRIEAQIKACERGNLVRRQINHRSFVLSQLLLSASESRRALAVLNRQSGDTGIARVNEKSARKYVLLRESLHPLQAVDCEQTVKNP